MLRRRLFSTKISPQLATSTNATADLEAVAAQKTKWRIRQVTRSNFKELLEEVKIRIFSSDFVAVSLQNTGAFSGPWHKVSSFDTPDTAYLKARRAAERFQVLQFALCPFTLKGSKLTAYPYNFHLFPRDELRLGMPSYSFSCQTSFLTSMARVGFDFNACIYDGISYLSRTQEPAAFDQLGIAHLSADAVVSCKASSVGDSVFMERIKSRVRNWRDAHGHHDPLIRSLSMLAAGSEEYGSRRSMDIDVCSERQVQLALEVLKEYTDDVVPLIIPSKGGETQAIRIILTSSQEDKALLLGELRDQEEKQKKRIRGFREVIDLISASEKPVVSHNALDDFTFIHSKFLGPLPSNIHEFEQSLGSFFPCILDLNHLMKEVSPHTAVTNLRAALSYMRNRFFAPIDIETSHDDSATEVGEGKVYGHNVLSISHLFGKLCSVLKRSSSKLQEDETDQGFNVKDYANNFIHYSSSSVDSFSEEDIQVSCTKKRSRRTLSSEDLVFLWGFRHGTSAGELKRLLVGSSLPALSEEDLFDVKLVDKSCAMIAFWRSGLSGTFLEAMSSCGTGSEALRDLVAEGLKAANYEVYRRACGMEIWELDLGDSLEKTSVLMGSTGCPEGSEDRSAFEIFWDNEVASSLDDQ